MAAVFPSSKYLPRFFQSQDLAQGELDPQVLVLSKGLPVTLTTTRLMNVPWRRTLKELPSKNPRLKLLDDLRDLHQYGVQLYGFNRIEDARGSLTLLYEGANETERMDISLKESCTAKSVGRGLHHQTAAFPQTKLIRVVEGEILDVLLDMNGPSEELICFYLAARDRQTIRIPANFAHGFIALSDVTFHYLCVGAYAPKYEVTVNVLPAVANYLGLGSIQLSPKDAAAPAISLMPGLK